MANNKNGLSAAAPLSVDTLENIVDLYIRVSTTEQAEEGYSVEAQETKLRAYCQAMGFQINRVCVDPGFSGASMERPGIKELIADVQHGCCKKILVWKLDRLSRSQKDMLILLEDVFLSNNCDFISLMESFDTSTPFGRCIVGILAAFAQMERDNIRMRTQMGRIAKIRKGHYSGSHAPIGYKFKPGCNELVIDPYTSIMVHEVYQLFLNGMGLSAIGRYIMDKYGSSQYNWAKNTAIRRILSNPVYMGKVRLNGELFAGIHEAIINETDWYMAAALLEHNKAIDKRSYCYTLGTPGRGDNLLTGLLFCRDCGARMYARKVSAKKKKYICHSVARTSPAMIKSDNCSNRLHPYTAEELDNLVINEIKKLAVDRSYFDSMVEDCRDESPAELSALQERVSEVEKQIDRLLNLYQTGLVGLDEVSQRLGTLKAEKEKLQQNLLSLDSAEAHSALDAAWKNLQDFSVVVDSGNLEATQQLIHALIDKIVVLNNDVTIYWSFC